MHEYFLDSSRLVHDHLGLALMLGVPVINLLLLLLLLRLVSRYRQSLLRSKLDEARHRAMFDTAVDGIVIIDGQGLIQSINDAAERMLGWRSAELVGRDMGVLMPEPYRTEYRSYLAASEAPGRANAIGKARDAAALTKNGRKLPIRLAMSRLPMQDAPLFVGFITDMTDYAAEQEALRAREARWRNLIQMSSDLYWEMDGDLRFTKFEGRGTSNMQYMQSALGHTPWDLWDPRKVPAAIRQHRVVLEARQAFRDTEIRRPGSEGGWIWVSVSGEPLLNPAGKFVGYCGVTRDITERKRAEDEIRRLAFFDELTGLPTRRLLLDRVAHVQAAGARDGTYGALMFLDLDNFKNINDSLGHEWGDRLLIQVAERLNTSLRASDSALRLSDDDGAARLGGDEFVVVLGSLAGEESEVAAKVEGVADKVLAALGQPYNLGGQKVHSTPSIGIVLFRGGDQNTSELLQRADLAMYQAKARGRNTLCFFDPAMQAAAMARQTLEADMRAGLSREEFLPYYQPVVDAAGQVIGAEVLARWKHPKRDWITPGEFIPVAEQTGLILPVGRLMLRAACQQLAKWAEHPSSALWTLSVNVSARQFGHSEFVRQTFAVIDELGVNPRLLNLELTESVLMRDVEGCIAKMQTLRDRGIRFSLDDFGTGYSSLSYLKRLPFDQLKIDQSFVRDVLTDSNDAALVCAVLAMAQTLGLDVVTEGVETEAQHEFLLRHGCRKFQGYLFGRPAPIEFFGRELTKADDAHV